MFEKLIELSIKEEKYAELLSKIKNTENYFPIIKNLIIDGKLSILKEIMKTKISFSNLQDENKNTPLHIALKVGNKEITNYLLSLKPALGVVNIDGETVLSLAIKNNDLPIIKGILKLNSNVIDISNSSGDSNLMLASMVNEELAIYLVKYAKKSYVNPNTGDSELIFAIKNKKLDLATKLIALEAGINIKDKNGKTPLNYAVDNNFNTISKLLLNKGASPWYVNPYSGDSELLYALKNTKDYTIANQITSLSSGLNLYDLEGKSALNYCVDFNLPELAKLLINKGAETKYINDKTGDTELLYAIKNNSPEIALIIAANGLGLNGRDIQGKTALNYAIDKEYIDVAKLLLKKDVSISTVNVQTAESELMYAIRKNSLEIAMLIANRQSSLSLRDNQGKSALMYATERNLEDLALHLISKGADTSSFNKMTGDTELIFAIKHNNLEVANKIISIGYGLSKADVNGETAMSLCIEHGYEDLAINLYKKSGLINNLINDKSMLAEATKKGMHKLLSVIATSGFGTSLKTSDGRSCLSVVLDYGYQDVAIKLIKNGMGVRNPITQYDEPIIWALKTNCLDVIPTMIDYGANLNTYDENGDSVFKLLCETKNTTIINKLFDRGFNVGLSADNVDTMLTYAIKQKNLSVVNKLINSGADINQMNGLFKTPFELSEELCFKINKFNGINKEKRHHFKDTSIYARTEFTQKRMRKMIVATQDIIKQKEVEKIIDIPPVSESIEDNEKMSAEKLRNKIKKML